MLLVSYSDCQELAKALASLPIPSSTHLPVQVVISITTSSQIQKKSKHKCKCKNFQTQIQRLSSTNTNTKTMLGMPATPTRLAPGHPLSFLSPVSPGFPSHLSPTLQVTNTNTDEKYQKRNDNTKCCSTWLSPPSRLFLLSRFHRWTIGQDRTR